MSIKNNKKARESISGVKISTLEDQKTKFVPFKQCPTSYPISDSLRFDPNKRRIAIEEALREDENQIE